MNLYAILEKLWGLPSAGVAEGQSEKEKRPWIHTFARVANGWRMKVSCQTNSNQTNHRPNWPCLIAIQSSLPNSAPQLNSRGI